jgi:glycosyltransferase involved in cell wall biosynthesis
VTETPRLSVLLPSWNAAATIERALTSVLDEHSIPLEVIVVDDGSTDATADLVRAVADRDPRVGLIDLPVNGGVSNARNQGLAAARGEWLAFIDADDRLFPSALATLLRPTADADVLAVIGQRIQNDGERNWITSGYDNPDVRVPGRKSLATHPSLMYYASIHGKVFHRSLLDGLAFEGRVLGDQPWTIRALLRAGDHIEVIGETVYEWSRPHPDRGLPGITAATHASAGGAAVMAGQAPLVFRAVADEIDLRIADEATRTRLKRAYFDRLVRSDLSVPVIDAVDRRDPATARLFDAVSAFIGSVPPETVAASELLVPYLLRPPARRWSTLLAAARPSYWAMLRMALRADPGLARRLPWRPSVAPAFALIARSDRPTARAIAWVFLWLDSMAARIAGRLRRS